MLDWRDLFCRSTDEKFLPKPVQPKAIFHSLVDLLNHVNQFDFKRLTFLACRSVQYSKRNLRLFNINDARNIHLNVFKFHVKFIHGYHHVLNMPWIIFEQKMVFIEGDEKERERENIDHFSEY